MNIHIITSEDGDWVGIYKDGLLMDEGHSFRNGETLAALGIEFTSEEWTQEQFDKHGCRCPSVLAGRRYGE